MTLQFLHLGPNKIGKWGTNNDSGNFQVCHIIWVLSAEDIKFHESFNFFTLKSFMVQEECQDQDLGRSPSFSAPSPSRRIVFMIYQFDQGYGWCLIGDLPSYIIFYIYYHTSFYTYYMLTILLNIIYLIDQLDQGYGWCWVTSSPYWDESIAS